jgi:molybdopterin-binding protein
VDRPYADSIDTASCLSLALFIERFTPAVRNLNWGIQQIVMPIPKLFTPREAAQVLGVSYPTLKQWIYKRKIKTVKTAGGHHRVPEKEVDRFLYRESDRAEVPERRSNYRRISGRNQLVGRVTDVKVSGLMAQVSISIGGQHITSIITADAVREMRLQKGQKVAALVKSTEVMIIRV